MLVAGLAERVLAREPVTIESEPGLRVNPIHVSDAARAIVAAIGADAPPGILNVAGAETVTLTQLVTGLGEPPACSRRSRTPARARRLSCSATTPRCASACVTPAVTLREGLRSVVAELRGA